MIQLNYLRFFLPETREEIAFSVPNLQKILRFMERVAPRGIERVQLLPAVRVFVATQFYGHSLNNGY